MMNYLRNLCTKVSLCFAFLAGWVFVSNVNAMEITDAPEAVESVEAVEATETVETANTTEIVEAPNITETMDVAGATDPIDTIKFLEMRAQNVDRLSRLIQVEGGRAFEDKVCVALTVLHRVDNPNFPSTIEDTINEPSQYATPTSGAVLPINLLAAEYAMQLWESGMSYTVLPPQFLYFAGNGVRNRFHDFHGHYHDLPRIDENIIAPYILGPAWALFIF